MLPANLGPLRAQAVNRLRRRHDPIAVRSKTVRARRCDFGWNRSGETLYITAPIDVNLVISLRPSRQTHCFTMKKSFHLPFLLAILAFLGTGAPHVQAQIPLTPNRAGHTETLLLSGKVLITGGENETAWLNSALLYDPSTGTFTPTGNMVSARAFHTSTLLQDGTVLITGGEQGTGLPLLKTAELYDPITGRFTQTSHLMTIARENHTATLLLDGRVVIEGGKQADIYNPITQTFVQASCSPTNRSSHAAVRLSDGTVLVTGGYVGRLPVADAWLFNPSTNCFTSLGTMPPHVMTVARANHAMTLLLDGTVLVTGGFSGTSPHDDVDIYNPISQTFSSAHHMLYHRSNHSAVFVPPDAFHSAGRVLVIGGTTLESGFLDTNEIYDPNTTIWSPKNPPMTENRSGQTATLLSNGQVLVAGGLTGNRTLQTAEILDPVSHMFTALPNMTAPRNQHTDTLLASGKVLLAAGSNDAVFENTAELFDPILNTFSPIGPLAVARKSHTATLLQDNNRVLIAGGKSATGDLASAELYNSSTGLFGPCGSMNQGRSLHTATLLPNGVLTFPPGSVLVAGGRKGPNPLNTAELFNPATNTFTFTGMLHIQRKRHAANLLLDGTVLVEGGASVSNGQPVDAGTPTAEIYNTTGPLAGTWSNHPPQDMSTGRTEHTATLLPDGTVIVSGGVSAILPSDLYNPATQSFSMVGGLLHQRQRHVSLLLTNPAWGSLVGKVLAIGGAYTGSPVFGGIQVALATVEMYDPATQQFTLFGNMTEPRQNHTATMLNDGRILIAGGVSSPAVSGTAELVSP